MGWANMTIFCIVSLKGKVYLVSATQWILSSGLIFHWFVTRFDIGSAKSVVIVSLDLAAITIIVLRTSIRCWSDEGGEDVWGWLINTRYRITFHKHFFILYFENKNPVPINTREAKANHNFRYKWVHRCLFLIKLRLLEPATNRTISFNCALVFLTFVAEIQPAFFFPSATSWVDSAFWYAPDLSAIA